LYVSCAPQRPVAFDGALAYRHVQTQLEFGPRVPGTEAHRRAADWIAAELRKTTEQVRRQAFFHTLPESGAARRGGLKDTLPLFNLIASFAPEKADRIMICAHWDSRPWADEEPDSSLHEFPVPGANDGASGVAVGLELARILGLTPPPLGVDIVFFDGEDLGTSDDLGQFLLGSKWFVSRAPNYRPLAVILVDMIGDADLQIPKERFSDSLAPALTQLVWDKAASLGLSAFVDSVGLPVVDDHLPFLFSGIPAVDLIDFDYPYWHTLADTADKVSPESLAVVGRLLSALIYDTPVEEYRRLQGPPGGRS
jgi:hypothetical protein